MNTDNIKQKLALLPDGVADENLQTWQQSIRYYQDKVSNYPGSRFRYLLALVEDVSQLEEAKLFRVYPSIWLLIISTTTKEDQDYGNFFIVVGLKDEDTTNVGCYRLKEVVESVVCKSNEILPTLQP